MRRDWRTGGADRVTFLLTTALIALFAALAWRNRWVADDGFINLRVVENIRAGLGPVWNAGERVEIYTSPLWVLLLWLTSSLFSFVALEWVAVGLGILGMLAGLALGARGSWLLWTSIGRTGVGLPLGLGIVVVLNPLWDFASSGLETGLSFFWIGGCFWLLARLHAAGAAQRRTGWRRALPRVSVGYATVAVGLGPLVRPDLAVFSAAYFVAVLVLAGRDWRRWLKLAAAAAALPLAYQIFRMGYFASLQPNTALAKEAGLSYWSRGLTYLKDFVTPYALYLPIGLVLAFVATDLRGGPRPPRAAIATALAPVVAGSVHALYVVRVGGDFMHGRLLLPGLFGILLPLLVVVPRALSWNSILAAAVVPWAIICALTLEPDYADRLEVGRIVDERGFYAIASKQQHPVTLDDYGDFGWVKAGRRLHDLSEADRRALVLRIPFLTDGSVRVSGEPRADIDARVVAGFGTVGMMGYAAGPEVHVVDTYALGDPIAARTNIGPLLIPPGTILEYEPTSESREYTVAPPRSRPGHEKYLPTEWIVARFAPPGRTSFPGVVLRPEKVVAARRALGCPRIRRIFEAISTPLDLGRFASNIRASFELTTDRFPAEPDAAERAVCDR